MHNLQCSLTTFLAHIGKPCTVLLPRFQEKFVPWHVLTLNLPSFSSVPVYSCSAYDPTDRYNKMNQLDPRTGKSHEYMKKLETEKKLS